MNLKKDTRSWLEIVPDSRGIQESFYCVFCGHSLKSTSKCFLFQIFFLDKTQKTYLDTYCQFIENGEFLVLYMFHYCMFFFSIDPFFYRFDLKLKCNQNKSAHCIKYNILFSSATSCHLLDVYPILWWFFVCAIN